MFLLSGDCAFLQEKKWRLLTTSVDLDARFYSYLTFTVYWSCFTFISFNNAKEKDFVPAYLTTTFDLLLYSYRNLLIKIYVFRISVLDITLYESFSVLSSNIHNLLFKLLFLFYFSLILIIIHTKLVLNDLRNVWG